MRLDELVIRGARERLREIERARDDDTRKVALRAHLVRRLRTGDGVDVDAAYEVRERGWTH